MKHSVPTADVRLFHVTLAANLEAIAAHGLRAGMGGSFSGYGWPRPRLFLSERGAVRCWWHKIEDLVEHHNQGEDIIPRLQVPIVLRIESFHFSRGSYPRGSAHADRSPAASRVRSAHFAARELVDDPAGSRDCIGGRSFFTEDTKPVAGRAIEVWNGRRWENLADVDPESVIRAYVKSEKHFQEDDAEWTEVELQLPGRWPW